jgi:DNA-binding transcriptional LysR family regulator
LRTTRKVTPTEAGLAFMARAKQVLHDVEAAEAAAHGIDSLRGLIRIAMPVSFGLRRIIPALPTFLAQHPQLRLDLIMSDERQDLVAEGVDLAIRFGDLASSSFGARRIATGRRFFIAAPAYLAARGTPQTIDELAAHDCIFGPGIASRQNWVASRNGVTQSVEVEGRIAASTGEGMMECVKLGLGIAAGAEWLAAADLASGRVVQILEDYDLASVSVHAVYPGGPRPSEKVRVLVDHLVAEIAR